MDILQTNKFKKFYKKLHKNQLIEVNKVLHNIIKNPLIGEEKLGDLSWLRVYKFLCLKQHILIGFNLNKEKAIITFVAIGSHENFYRDLKN